MHSTILHGTHLSHGAKTPLELELIDTNIGGFAELVTFVNLPLSTTTTDTYTIDYISLLGLVTEATGLIGTCGIRCSVYTIQLAILPTPNTKQESEEVRLLLSPQLF